MVCTLTALLCWIAGESDPRINFAAAVVKSGSPVIGRYSWSKVSSLSKIWVAWIAHINNGGSHLCLARTHLFNNGQDPRLVVVIAVRSDAKIDLFVVSVHFVGSSQFEDAIDQWVSEAQNTPASVNSPVRGCKGNRLPEFFAEVFLEAEIDP